MTKPARFKQAEISRAVKAAKENGCGIARIEVSDEKFVIITTLDPTAKEAADAYDAVEYE